MCFWGLPTLTLPSSLFFLFPSPFSLLSLALPTALQFAEEWGVSHPHTRSKKALILPGKYMFRVCFKSPFRSRISTPKYKFSHTTTTTPPPGHLSRRWLVLEPYIRSKYSNSILGKPFTISWLFFCSYFLILGNSFTYMLVPIPVPV